MYLSIISTIVINYLTPRSSSSKFNHLKEDPPSALSPPTKSSHTLKTRSNHLPSISSPNSKKISRPYKNFDFSSHKIISKKTSELILSSKSLPTSKTKKINIFLDRHLTIIHLISKMIRHNLILLRESWDLKKILIHPNLKSSLRKL